MKRSVNGTGVKRLLSFELLLVLVFLWVGVVPAADHSVFVPRPIDLGVSGININEGCSAGTLGSLVKKSGKPAQYILSNNHVLAMENDGEKGDLIIQPGSLDDGCQFRSDNKVAKLKKFVRIVFSTTANNEVDAAIAKVLDGAVDSTGEILDIGQVSSTPVNPVVGQGVKKAGRTTDLTTSTVSAVGVTVNVTYSTGTARFINQFSVGNSFSAAGDSGSLIVTNKTSCPNPVGLLFAGGGGVTFANPINKVYQAFGVVPVGCSSSAEESAVDSDALIAAEQAVASALAVKERNEESIMNTPGVVGVGVGLEDNVGVIHVYLETNEAKEQLPESIEGVRVLPVVTGKIVPY